MLIKLLSLSFMVLIAIAPVGSAWSDSAKLLGKTGDWESFSYSDKSGKVCYTASLPKHSLNAPKGRSESHLSITDRVADKSVGVISVSEGFPVTKDGEIDIGGAKFDLYASDNALWSRADKAVVQTMLKGKSLLVYGAPAKGAQVVDTYSLDGFAKAYADIGKACGLH
jgi:hypothetical protein